jgi:hypothetical protein
MSSSNLILIEFSVETQQMASGAHLRLDNWQRCTENKLSVDRIMVHAVHRTVLFDVDLFKIKLIINLLQKTGTSPPGGTCRFTRVF